MKKEIHPDYHDITVVMTDGTEFVTKSTYGKEGARMQLDVDAKTHPAWTGRHHLVDRGGQLAKFNKRFAGLDGKKKESSEKEAAPKGKDAKIKLTTKAVPKKKVAAKKVAPKKAAPKKED